MRVFHSRISLMIPKFIRRDAEQSGSLEKMADNTKNEAAAKPEVQVTTAPETGNNAAESEVVNATTGVEKEAVTATGDDLVTPEGGELPTNETEPESTESEDNLDNEPFDEERWRNTLKGFREREKEAAKRFKELESSISTIEEERAALKQQLLTHEEQQAIEQDKLKELAEQRGSKLSLLEQEAHKRQKELEAQIQSLQSQNTGLNEELHIWVDETIAEWPESIKVFIPGRKEASAEVRAAAVKKGKKAVEDLLDKSPAPGNGPTPVSPMQVNTQDAVRTARGNRMYDVI
jgi:chromosome segregation ATPase